MGYNLPNFGVGQISRYALHVRMSAFTISECDKLIQQIDSALAGEIRRFDISADTIKAVTRRADGQDRGTLDSLSNGILLWAARQSNHNHQDDKRRVNAYPDDRFHVQPLLLRKRRRRQTTIVEV
jgi:hypothetical protein